MVGRPSGRDLAVRAADRLGHRLAAGGCDGPALGLGVAYYAMTLPAFTALVDGRARGSVTMLDRYGEVFAWRGEQFGGMIMADQVSPYLRDAVVATEDRRFYWHPGIDPRGIASAIRINLREGEARWRETAVRPSRSKQQNFCAGPPL